MDFDTYSVTIFLIFSACYYSSYYSNITRQISSIFCSDMYISMYVDTFIVDKWEIVTPDDIIS